MELSDLLSLSRTTKAFRELVLAPEAKRFWTSAMRHSEAAGVPPCPQWLNILEYANLLYSPRCHVRTHIFIRSLRIDIRICYVLELSRWKYQFHSVNLLRVGRTLLQEMSRQVRRKSKPTLSRWCYWLLNASVSFLDLCMPATTIIDTPSVISTHQPLSKWLKPRVSHTVLTCLVHEIWLEGI